MDDNEIERLRRVVCSLIEKMAEFGLLAPNDLRRYEAELGINLSPDAWVDVCRLRADPPYEIRGESWGTLRLPDVSDSRPPA